MKYIKTYEDNFNEEVKHIIDNYDPYVVKIQEVDRYFSVLIKDKNSDFESWLDVWVTDTNNDIESEWNQQIYYNNNSNDIIKKEVESDNDVFSMSESVALYKLLDDNMIYEEDDKYYYYSDYWYVKDGYKDKGISLDKAREIKKYNL
jgi:hypothetical protein